MQHPVEVADGNPGLHLHHQLLPVDRQDVLQVAHGHLREEVWREWRKRRRRRRRRRRGRKSEPTLYMLFL